VLGHKPRYVLLANVVHGASGALPSTFLYCRVLWADARSARQYTLLREFADNLGAGTTFLLYARRTGPWARQG